MALQERPHHPSLFVDVTCASDLHVYYKRVTTKVPPGTIVRQKNVINYGKKNLKAFKAV